jgi:TonB family protein
VIAEVIAEVIEGGLNHLWQSTVFAIAAGLLTIAFRHNRAHIRYWLWFSASVKFFVPFTLLINIGSLVPWTQAAQWLVQNGIAAAVVQVGQPFPDTWLSVSSAPSTPDFPNWLGLTIFGAWACGFGSIALIRLQMWRRIRAVVRASTPFQILEPEMSVRVQVRSAPGLLEPGVVGWLRPILLLPAGIEEHLTPPQLHAVLAHEMCHLRRRDNFTAGIHMVSEAVFWFHPLVWWIGAQLVDERESACDEEVIRLGSNPRVYAESILKTCEFYVESPLACVTGVTGSDLTKRIEAIMRNQAGKAVSLRKKLVLGAAIVLAVAIPVGVGVLNASRLHSESAATDATSSALKVASSGLQIDATNFCCPDYLVRMTDHIRVNWVRQSEADGRNVVKFTIQRDGHIAEVVLEKASGFQRLDELSQQAVRSTKSLDPLPPAFPNPTLTVHLNFEYQR